MDVQPKSPVNQPGTKEWSIKIRRRARELAEALDTGYLEMAEILWKVWNTPIDGDPNKPAVFKAWGYDTFADYAEKELGLAKRRAERLRQIYHHLEVRLGDRIPKLLRKRVLALGWSKVREIAPLLTPENAEKWVELAERVNYVELTAETRKMRRKVEELRDRKDAEANGEAPVTDAASDLPDDPSYAEAETILNAAEFDPEELRVKTKVFPLFPDMVEPVERALERASELSHSASVSHNLTLICTDFLATNSFKKKNDVGNLVSYLARIETTLGVKLMAVDPAKKQVVYGLETLRLLDDEDS